MPPNKLELLRTQLLWYLALYAPAGINIKSPLKGVLMTSLSIRHTEPTTLNSIHYNASKAHLTFEKCIYICIQIMYIHINADKLLKLAMIYLCF